jgi:hypothetical protein
LCQLSHIFTDELAFHLLAFRVRARAFFSLSRHGGVGWCCGDGVVLSDLGEEEGASDLGMTSEEGLFRKALAKMA